MVTEKTMRNSSQATGDAMEMRTEAASWKCATRTAWYDSKEGMLVCGKKRQTLLGK